MRWSKFNGRSFNNSFLSEPISELNKVVNDLHNKLEKAPEDKKMQRMKKLLDREKRNL